MLGEAGGRSTRVYFPRPPTACKQRVWYALCVAWFTVSPGSNEVTMQAQDVSELFKRGRKRKVVPVSKRCAACEGFGVNIVDVLDCAGNVVDTRESCCAVCQGAGEL